MSYLKIFPRSIVAKIDGSVGYVGRMVYDFEQYGRMMYDVDSEISLLYRWQPDTDWLIQSTQQVQLLAGFSVFMHAMNHYLFDVLQFDPVSQCRKASDTNYEFFFERVYFDMGTREFNSIQKIAVADDAETARSFWSTNVRS